MRASLRLPRGFRDYKPGEYELLERIRSEFIETTREYGFRLMEPSTIEMLETLEAKSGPGVREEIFHFTDKAGRSVALRFDLTVGLTRYYCSDRSLPKTLKLAVFGDVWRYDEPQKGRFRWFYQWDAEVFGPRGFAADFEVISFTSRLLTRLGLNQAYFIVNDRRLTERLVRERAKDSGVELRQEQVLELFRALDKLERKSKQEVVDEYARKGFDPSLLNTLISSVLEAKKDEKLVLELIEEWGLGDLASTTDLMRESGMSFKIDPSLARGLDYYTSIVFEVKHPGAEDIGSIAGGGRYDVLTSIFGRPDSGATGVAGGVDRTIEVLKRLRPPGGGGEGVDACIIYTQTSLDYALLVAHKLRSKGVRIDLPMYDEIPSFKRMFLDKVKKYKVLVITGDREKSRGEVRVRFVDERKEVLMSVDEAAKALSE